ncbi:MAG: NADH-quinone oxidoreductase subunit N, partial [Methylovulum sp.]
MTQVFNMADLSTASPEVILSLVAMVILTLDFIAPKGGRDWLGYLSILGVLVTFAVLIGQWGTMQPAFNGQYVSDPFSFFFKIVFLVSAALILLMSIGYLKSEGIDKGEFYGLILFATLGMMLMVSAVDLLILYIGLETMSISIYILAGFMKRERRSSEAALKYLLMGGFSSAIILYGIVMLYGLTGTIGLQEIASSLSADSFSNPALI